MIYNCHFPKTTTKQHFWVVADELFFAKNEFQQALPSSQVFKNMQLFTMTLSLYYYYQPHSAVNPIVPSPNLSQFIFFLKKKLAKTNFRILKKIQLQAKQSYIVSAQFHVFLIRYTMKFFKFFITIKNPPQFYHGNILITFWYC